MFSQIVSALKIPPGRERITNQEALRFTYDYWRQRVIFSMIVGYAIFYFCRKNIAFSNPLIREDLDISATSLGLILTAHSVIYGFSKFFSGILADRSNARYFMAIGLFFSALMNIGFGFSSGVLFFAVFWIANGIFQGSGVPPCSRMLTMWFSKRESGTYWGIWNASHQLGGAGISLLASYLVATGYGWRSTFFVPAFIAIATAAFLVWRLRDRPTSLGLPPIKEYEQIRGYKSASDEQTSAAPSSTAESTSNGSEQVSEETELSTWQLLRQEVLNKPVIWMVCLANFFVYIVRIGFLDWGTTYLNESGLEKETWGVIVAVFEITGLLGALLAGYLSDRRADQRGLVAVISMLLLTAALVVFWQLPSADPYIAGMYFGVIGLFVYGPQLLVAVVAAQAAPRAAGTAVGLTGLVGYAGASVCSVVTGVLLDYLGIDAVILFYLLSAALGAISFLASLKMERAA